LKIILRESGILNYLGKYWIRVTLIRITLAELPTIKYYPASSTINPATGIGYPTIEILSNNITVNKFRFEL
jgi:hypothetical protein